MLSVPVGSRSDRLVGVFNVHARERREFGARDIEFLRLTASLVAEAIDHANLFGKLAEKEQDLEALIRRTIELLRAAVMAELPDLQRAVHPSPGWRRR